MTMYLFPDHVLYFSHTKVNVTVFSVLNFLRFALEESFIQVYYVSEYSVHLCCRLLNIVSMSARRTYAD